MRVIIHSFYHYSNEIEGTMSKRSRRRKRRERQQKKEAQLTGEILAERGLRAFKQADYDQAIDDWGQAQHKKDGPATLTSAMAEAYFRRALSSAAPDTTDLEGAVELCPDDALYRYHLALAHHRAGDLDQAEPIYRQLLKESPPFERAAAPLAQLLIDKKRPLSKEDVGDYLPAETEAQLIAAEALIRKKATSTLEQLAETPLDPLWQGLVAVALEDTATAHENLQSALEKKQLHPVAAGVVHYYLGVLAANEKRLEEAQKAWQIAQASGFESQALRHNLDITMYRELLAERQAGRPAQALALLDKIRLPGAMGINPHRLRQQLNWEAADVAARKGEWPQALNAWQNVDELGDESRSLIFNLALAYQKTEHHWEAAERWRELLRRRPRKADNPDYLTDEQVARIWQNVADNYGAAGDYEEATKTYKNAVKWAPENLDLRLKLVDALQADGRWQAAENELNRILEKKPDHIPAMLTLAESMVEERWRRREAQELLLKVLALEPQNPIARQQLAHLYEEEGTFAWQWGRPDQALKVFHEGLEKVPNSPRLLFLIGDVHLSRDEVDEARRYFDKALAVNPADLQLLHALYMAWLDTGSEPDINQTFEQIKAIKTSIPSGFFLDLINHCLEYEYYDHAEELIDYTEAHYQEDVPTMLALVELFRRRQEDKRALATLRHIIKEHPDHAEANMELGTLYFEMDQTRLAKRHWQKAEAQARKENNQMLLYQIKTTKDVFLHGKQPPQNVAQFFHQMPPELRQELLAQAPPEIAEVLRNMSPEMLESILREAMSDEAGPFDIFDEDDDVYF